MRKFLGVVATLVVSLSLCCQTQAAFIVEAAAGLASATNFSFGGDTTSASTSIASAAVAATGGVGLAGSSRFGGDGTASDTYVYSYTPGVDADNAVFNTGDLLGSTTGFGTEFSSGLTGGASGTYNVYLTTPSSTNVNAAGSNFTITNDGADVVLPFVDTNDGGTGPDLDPGMAFVGGANNAWFLLGTVDLTAGTTYTVTQDSNAVSFVSQRSHAIMWELVPEPGSGLLMMMVLGMLPCLRRR